MESFYGSDILLLETTYKEVLTKIELIKNYCNINGKRNPVEHCEGRIKSEASMIDKLKRKGLEVTVENAFTKVHDAVGIRVICRFVDDVYDVIKMIKGISGTNVIEEKDYILNPKPNGYRSYHIIILFSVEMPGETRKIPVEIQVRTIAQDCWAALEHTLKYKHEIKNVELLQKELKRCADEMASTDLTMQTVRQMIDGEI